MWNINTISKKKRSGSVKYTVSIKNVANATGTLTATPVEGNVETIELDPGSTYILMLDVEKGKSLSTVYESVGIEYDASHSYTADTSRIINSNTTIDANITYVVTFDTNGGSAVEPQYVPYGVCATRPADPTKQDYVFAGWYGDDTLETPFEFETDFIAGDTVIYAKWEEPTPVTEYTITIHNEDGEEACTLTATPVVGNVEIYNVSPNLGLVLTQRVEAGNAISTVYSSIVADFNGSTVSIDVSTIMDEDKTFNVSIPHPSLGKPIRLVNNSSTESFTYEAYPTGGGGAETGTVVAGSLATLVLEVADEGDAVSTVYDSIAVTYTNQGTRYLDTSVVATSDAYVDYELSDTVPVVIDNRSTTQSATLTYRLIGGSDVTESIPAGGSITLPTEVTYGEQINTIYEVVKYTYPGLVSEYELTWQNAYDTPIIINDVLIISFNNSGSETCTLTATKLDTTSETHTIQQYGSADLDEKIALGGTLNDAYSSIVITYTNGTINMDVSTSVGPGTDGVQGWSVEDAVRIGIQNNSATDSAKVSYTLVGATEPEEVTIQAGSTDYCGWNNVVALGSAPSTVFSEIKYSYDGGTTWTQIDLTTAITASTNWIEYVIGINNI